MRLQNIPKGDRPRERLYRHGVEAMSDRELLALVLRNGRPGESALDLATSLIGDYGGLSGLATARPEELATRSGVGEAKAAAVAAAFRLSHIASQSAEPLTLRSGKDIARVAMRELAGARRERTLVLVCNSANRLQRIVQVSDGAMDRSLLPIREVLNAVLRHDGRAFALVHNHPSGEKTPSKVDRKVTVELAAAARTVGLRFLDHVVVGGNDWSSCYDTVEKTRLSSEGERA